MFFLQHVLSFQRICLNTLGTHHCTEHFALRHKLKSCTVPFLYRSELVTFRRMLYRPDVCNCTMPYVHRTVSAYAIRYPAQIAEVVALTLVRPPCGQSCFKVPSCSFLLSSQIVQASQEPFLNVSQDAFLGLQDNISASYNFLASIILNPVLITDYHSLCYFYSMKGKKE